MKKIFILSLLCLFLTGCKIEFEDSFSDKLWKKFNLGDAATFSLTHRKTYEEKYYKIERISEEEFKSLRK